MKKIGTHAGSAASTRNSNPGLYILVTNSTALEGSTLTLEQNRKLLDDGVSSEGKTIAEQLLNLDLFAAYKSALDLAEEHQGWSGYRIKTLASTALRSYGFDCTRVRDEAALQRICQEANEIRLRARSLGDADLYKAGFRLHFRFSEAALWPEGNNIMGRLMMNMLQAEFGLGMLSVSKVEDYNRILSSALSEGIADIFVLHADKVMSPAGKCPDITGGGEARVSAPKTSTRILEILAVHPRYTAADLAEKLHINSKGVEKHLANLKKSGALLRVGPDKGGHWQVLRIF